VREVNVHLSYLGAPLADAHRLGLHCPWCSCPLRFCHYLHEVELQPIPAADDGPAGPLTPADLQHLRRLCAEAPPGPWYAGGNHLDDADGRAFARAMGHLTERSHDTFCRASEFIAEARTAVPLLLAALDALTAENRALRAARPTTRPAARRGARRKE